MSTDAPPSPRSPSPATESVADNESYIVHLKDIKTIAQFYKSGLLKAARMHRWDPEPNFLERVSL